MSLMDRVRGRTAVAATVVVPERKRGYRHVSTYQIETGVPRPANLPNRPSGALKYPLRDMPVGGFFRVPKEDFFPDGEPFDAEKYDAKKLRDRVQQGVRNIALKINQEAAQKPDFDRENYTPVKFTVAVLGEGMEGIKPEWYGDVGVWRDS